MEGVWEAISLAVDWPSWWRGVERVVELCPGDAEGLGAQHRYTWKSALPYRLTLDIEAVEVVRRHRLVGMASGELSGRGCWSLWEDGGVTVAHFYWQVRTTKRWMNLLAPLLRPAFAWNHKVVMRWGGHNLARRLRTRLVPSPGGRLAVPDRSR
jgi:hypothetical protein